MIAVADSATIIAYSAGCIIRLAYCDFKMYTVSMSSGDDHIAIEINSSAIYNKDSGQSKKRDTLRR